MDETNFVEKVTNDMEFTASVCEGLLQKPKALKQLVAYKEVTDKLIKDPVFFAVLMCGDKWLTQAPEHQKLLRDVKLKTGCGLRPRMGQKPGLSAEKISGYSTLNPK